MSTNIVLRGGLLIDGTGVAPIPDSALRIENGKITRVGRQSDFGESGFEGAEIIEVEGQTIMPGLINAHEHLDLHHSYGSWEERMAEFSTVYWSARGFRNSLLALSEGVTTVRDLGSKEGTSAHLKKAIDNGMILGPRVLTCIQPLTITGGHGWQICREVDGPDGFRQAARQLLYKEGADLIKCMISKRSYVNATNNPWSIQLTVEEMKAALDESHNAGKLTTVHCHPPKGIQWAVEAGVDCIEHGDLIDRPSAELLADKGVFLVPTLGEVLIIADRGDTYQGRPRWMVELFKEGLENKKQSFSFAVEAGVRILVGTDTCDTMAEEMELMVQGGMSPMDVIVSATRNGAQVCGLVEQTGTLEEGKWADVIVVEGNPVKDISMLTQVKRVFKEGTMYQPEMLKSAIGKYPL